MIVLAERNGIELSVDVMRDKDGNEKGIEFRIFDGNRCVSSAMALDGFDSRDEAFQMAVASFDRAARNSGNQINEILDSI